METKTITRTCPKHKVPLTRQYNSTILYCPQCRMEHNKELLRQSFHDRKEKQGRGKKRHKEKTHVPWKEKPLNEMIQYVQDKIVNPYIRLRDQTNFGKCISSNGPIKHAGHFYSVGSHPGMRFNIQNIHGQSIHSNMWQSGDLHKYRKGLIERHGQAYMDELDELEIIYKQYGYKFDKFNVILIAETYLYLTKNKIWIYRQKEFDELKNGIILKFKP